MTNDFRNWDPVHGHALEPISLVTKVTSANGRPAVKLSDNPSKPTGGPVGIARCLRIFGQDGMSQRSAFV